MMYKRANVRDEAENGPAELLYQFMIIMAHRIHSITLSLYILYFLPHKGSNFTRRSRSSPMRDYLSVFSNLCIERFLLLHGSPLHAPMLTTNILRAAHPCFLLFQTPFFFYMIAFMHHLGREVFWLMKHASDFHNGDVRIVVVGYVAAGGTVDDWKFAF
jgi:hypothetical protein